MISSSASKHYDNLAEAREAFNADIDARVYPSEKCPSHYDNVIQPWDYMKSTLTDEAFCGYLEGNIIKYISRWRSKDGLKDLKKAQHYLDKLIHDVEGEE